jgi:hypothetical protein
VTEGSLSGVRLTRAQTRTTRATEPEPGNTTLDEAISSLIATGIPRMDAIKTVAHERGLSKREVYRLVNLK